jgi:hypothetical protein
MEGARTLKWIRSVLKGFAKEHGEIQINDEDCWLRMMDEGREQI